MELEKMNRFTKPFLTCCSVALEVEGWELWVCPQQLASKSEVFNQMFFGTGRRLHSSSSTSAFPILKTSLEAFVPFLCLLTDSGIHAPTAQVLKKSNCLQVIELAERFQVLFLKQAAIRFLEEDMASSEYSDENLLDVLAMCDLFDLKALKTATLGKVVSWGGEIKFRIDLIRRYKDQLQAETLRELLQRKLVWRYHHSLYSASDAQILDVKKESLKTLGFLEEMNMTGDWLQDYLERLRADVHFKRDRSPRKTTVQGKDGNSVIAIHNEETISVSSRSSSVEVLLVPKKSQDSKAEKRREATIRNARTSSKTIISVSSTTSSVKALFVSKESTQMKLPASQKNPPGPTAASVAPSGGDSGKLDGETPKMASTEQDGRKSETSQPVAAKSESAGKSVIHLEKKDSGVVADAGRPSLFGKEKKLSQEAPGGGKRGSKLLEGKDRKKGPTSDASPRERAKAPESSSGRKRSSMNGEVQGSGSPEAKKIKEDKAKGTSGNSGMGVRNDTTNGHSAEATEQLKTKKVEERKGEEKKNVKRASSPSFRSTSTENSGKMRSSTREVSVKEVGIGERVSPAHDHHHKASSSSHTYLRPRVKRKREDSSVSFPHPCLTPRSTHQKWTSRPIRGSKCSNQH